MSKKLSDWQIIEIYSRYYSDQQVKQSQLASEYGVTQAHISNIIRGRSRDNVTEEIGKWTEEYS